MKKEDIQKSKIEKVMYNVRIKTENKAWLIQNKIDLDKLIEKVKGWFITKTK